MSATLQRDTKSQTLMGLLSEIASHGDTTALIEFKRDDVQSASYAELDRQIQQLARGLRRNQSESNSHTVVIAPLTREWIIAALATIDAGRVLVPLDVQLTDDVLSGVLEDSGAQLIFTNTDQVDRLEELDLPDGTQIALLDQDKRDKRSWLHLSADEEVDIPEPEPDDTAILFYTSGTTGPPKGVPLSHANIVFELNALRAANLVSEHDRVLLPLPGHHVYPLIVGILTPLVLRTPIVLPLSLTGPQIQRALREGEATIVIGVPRLYEALLTGIESEAASRGRIVSAAFRLLLSLDAWLPRRAARWLGSRLFRPLHTKIAPKLRVLASGGAPLDPQLARRLEALGWQVAIGYGLTETSPLATINPPGEGKLESVGRPLPDVEIRIDTAALPGSPTDRKEGEILVRGPNVFAGYHNLPDKTAEALSDDGWFRTGDLGRIDDDGYLYVTGRLSTLFKTKSGKFVQPDKVEEAYAGSSAIREIGVLEDGGQLVAVVVPATNVARTIKGAKSAPSDALRRAIEERARTLPTYHRISDFVVAHESLPRTRLGKIQRHELADLYQRIRSGDVEQPAAEPMTIEEMSAEDRTLLEDAAALESWNLLAEKYPDQRLTPDTNTHLDLGIDSMEWLNLSLQIRERAEVELGDEAIGRVESVRDLLREVSAGQAAGETGGDFLDDPEQTLSDHQKTYLEPQGKFQAAVARSGFAINRSLMSVVFGVEVNGMENLPAEQFIVTPNHSSYLDSFAIAAALDWSRLERTYWGGLAGVTIDNPLTRVVSRLAKVVPVDPQRGVISSLAFAAAVLERGHNLIWYPEGGLSPDGKLQDFKPGIGLLLMHYPVSVVPTWIDGTFEALPTGKIMPHVRKITVTFGEPIEADDLVGRTTAAERDDYSKQQKHHARIAKKLQQQLARLADRSAKQQRRGG